MLPANHCLQIWPRNTCWIVCYRTLVQLLCSYSTLPLYALVTQVCFSLAITSVMEVMDSSACMVEAPNPSSDPNSDIYILFQSQVTYFTMSNTISLFFQELEMQFNRWERQNVHFGLQRNLDFNWSYLNLHDVKIWYSSACANCFWNWFWNFCKMFYRGLKISSVQTVHDRCFYLSLMQCHRCPWS